MDFALLDQIKNYVPIPVIVAIIAVIMLVYVSMFIAKIVEEYLEDRDKKEIHFFDHKKIWLSLFWCIVTSLTLALAGFITWKELPFYTLVILGGSTFLYESFIKKVVDKE